MPESRAASWFPPMAYKDLPKTVRFNTKPVIANITSITRIGTGIGPSSLPSQLTSAGSPMGRPSEITRVSPREMDSIASVAMQLGSSTQATARPLASPASSPNTGPPMSASTPGSPEEAIQPAPMPDRAAILPTDRSIPAETIANVTPNARMATTAACTPTLRRLRAVRNSGVAMNMARHTTRSPTSAPFSARNALIRCQGPRLAAGADRVVVSVDTAGLDLLDRQRHHGVLRRFVGGQFTRDAAAGHHDDTITHAEHFGKFARCE